MVRKIQYRRPGVIVTLLLAFILCFGIQSCKKSRSDLGKTLHAATGNKVFKSVENEAYVKVFRQLLEEEQSKLSHPKLISRFYEKNGYEPVILLQHAKDKGLMHLQGYFERAAEHGLNPELFDAKAYKEQIAMFYAKKGIKNTAAAYRAIAKLELLSASSLLRYSNAMQFGVLSPKRIYASYYTDTKRPDSAVMERIFAVKT